MRFAETANFAVCIITALTVCLTGFHALADKEELYSPYTSSDEFLPLGSSLGDKDRTIDLSFLEDESYIHRAELAGIRLLKDENRLIFVLKADDPAEIMERELKFEVSTYNCPPRIVIRMYGVLSDEQVIRFFNNLNILGVIRNPFMEAPLLEFIVFLEDWAETAAEYSAADKELSLSYMFAEPPIRRGFGVRIADTKLDPLPQIIEIKRELTHFGLENFLLVASDEQTVVLESPFFPTRNEAVEYIESLERFGFKGKLAIREYREFPQPNRVDVVSEAVITGEGDVNLENIVYSELLPERIFMLSHAELYLITKQIFSPRVQNEDELIAEYFYTLSEIFMNYETSETDIKEMAVLVSIKFLEIIYFNYPETQRADDALWEMANHIREYGVEDEIGEIECYNKILSEYPESIFADESGARIQTLRGE
jgi:hypothetical protein